jgi:hypothetical protein
MIALLPTYSFVVHPRPTKDIEAKTLDTTITVTHCGGICFKGRK